MRGFIEEYRKERNFERACSKLAQLRMVVSRNLTGEFEITIDINAIFEAAHQTKLLDELESFLEAVPPPMREEGMAFLAQLALSTNQLILNDFVRRKLDKLALKFMEASQEESNFLTMRNCLWFLANLYSSFELNDQSNQTEDLFVRVIAAVKPCIRNQEVALKFSQFFAMAITRDPEAYCRYITQEIIQAALAVLFEGSSLLHQNDCLVLLSQATRIQGDFDEAPYAIMMNYIIAEGFIDKFLNATTQTGPGFDETSLILFWRIMHNFASLDGHIEVDRVVFRSPRV